MCLSILNKPLKRAEPTYNAMVSQCYLKVLVKFAMRYNDEFRLKDICKIQDSGYTRFRLDLDQRLLSKIGSKNTHRIFKRRSIKFLY